jgi:hypothetical protein
LSPLPTKVKEAGSLYQTILNEASFYRQFVKFDEDLAEEARQAGCACGGRLHSARYPRKPRGVPEELEADYSRRSSFCCAQEGCRRRTTPASFRFLARRVYVGTVMVLLTALRHGATPGRVALLRAMVGVSRRTLERWRRWWQEEFPGSQFWRGARGRLARPVDAHRLPLSLLESFSEAGAEARAVGLLRFILSLTTTSFVQET